MDRSFPDNAPQTGVSMAIIDTGVNPRHPHVGVVTGGVAFVQDESGDLHQSEDYIDRRGHGTALAGIVRVKAPRVALYAVKIFRDPITPNDPLTTSIDALEAGLHWAIRRQTRIINMSLGVTNPAHRGRLQTLIDQAHASALFIVASAPPGNTATLPAALPGVIAVAGEETCAWNEYRYVQGDSVPFRAHPYPRPVPGLPQERNFHGHSCAAAHVAALLALLLEHSPDLTVDAAKTALKETILLNSTR